jgi:hypothetical protein
MRQHNHRPNFRPPKLVRKPKPSTMTFKNDTFLEETVALQSKRKKYGKKMSEIRARNVTYEEAGCLVIKVL